MSTNGSFDTKETGLDLAGTPQLSNAERTDIRLLLISGNAAAIIGRVIPDII
jgi:hypothetical protein